MSKKHILLLLFLFAAINLRAQESKTVFERYIDFNLERLTGDSPTALAMGEALLDSVNALPLKSKIGLYNGMGKLYEDNGQTQKAIIYYEKVATAVPNYYVVHRALGYIYLAASNQILAQLVNYKPTDAAYTPLKNAYKIAAQKALPHLEIAQACDPSDDTLLIIKTTYTNIGNTTALTTLGERLKQLSKNCLDILSEN